MHDPLRKGEEGDSDVTTNGNLEINNTNNNNSNNNNVYNKTKTKMATIIITNMQPGKK